MQPKALCSIFHMEWPPTWCGDALWSCEGLGVWSLGASGEPWSCGGLGVWSLGAWVGPWSSKGLGVWWSEEASEELKETRISTERLVKIADASFIIKTFSLFYSAFQYTKRRCRFYRLPAPREEVNQTTCRTAHHHGNAGTFKASPHSEFSEPLTSRTVHAHMLENSWFTSVKQRSK